jgi:hypothetical protein
MALPKNYYNYFDICKQEGINPNTAKSAIGDGGVEGISSIAFFKPIAHLFREFPKGLRKQYGILCRHYDTWKQTGHVPKVSSGRPPKWTGEEKHLNIPVPYFYEHWVTSINELNKKSTNKINLRDAVYFAMEDYMERHPSIFGVDCAWKQDNPNKLK